MSNQVKKGISVPKEELEDFRRLFQMIDTDGDGQLTGTEIDHMFRVAGCNPTEQDIQNILAVTDTDKNRTIDLDEFVELMRKGELPRDQIQQKKEIKEAFAKFDKNGDGLIDKEEFKAIMKLGGDINEEEIEAAWTAADKNGDGVLQYDEFAEMWTT